MKIVGVEFKNFNSYGNKITKVDFSDNSNMVMLIGQSGHGKSTLREVISYLAYGKVQDKNNGDLINRVNNNLWGKIKLIANKKVIEIERGMKPSIFNVTINGEPLETAGKSNIQSEIENEYFKIPQSTFDNVISISIDKFKSFLTMRPKDKRKILDQIFGISFFNKVNDKLKEQLKEYSNNIETVEGQILVLNENKKQIDEKIKSIDENKNKNIITKLNEIDTVLIKLSEELRLLSNKSSDISNKKITVEKKYKEVRKLKIEKENELKNILHKIELYENDQCPECGSSLCTKEHNDIKDNLTIQKEELEKLISELRDKITKIDEVNTKISNSYDKIQDKLFDIRIEQRNTKSEQLRLNEEQQKSSNDFTEVLENTLTKLDVLLSNLDILKNDSYIYSELMKIFGEEGVKSQITKNFLPSFNKNINEFSRKLHFPYKIEIDERFATKISAIGEEINSKTLSTGERKKADFAVLIALIKVMKRNYPTINLMFLDEILASIDSYGVYEMLTLIKSVVTDLNLNAFVINHSELPSEFFNSIYSVNKVAGFSELEIEIC